jgi:hypothetical protein
MKSKSNKARLISKFDMQDEKQDWQEKLTGKK